MRQRPWAGLTVLAGDRLLTAMGMLVVVLAVLDGAWATVLAPAYGQRVLHDAAALGWLLGVFGAGALAGNLVSAWVTMRADRHLLVWTCLAAGTTLRYAALNATHALLVLTVTMLVAGLALGLLGPLWLALLSDRTDAPVQGHVFGVTFALEQGATALGALLAGVTLSRLGLRPTLAGAAATGAVLALLAATAPPLKQLHRR